MNLASNHEILSNLRCKYSCPKIPEGIVAFKIQRYFDERGFFQQDLNSVMLQNLGFGNFFQKNVSKSDVGVIRGMHWQKGNSGQTKIISCLQGSVIDVIVDLRRESQTYGEINSFKLNSDDPYYIKIPSGFAHGFQALEPDTIFVYWVDAPFAPNSEKSMSPLSAEIEVYWEAIAKTINQRDLSAITYKEYFSENSNRIES